MFNQNSAGKSLNNLLERERQILLKGDLKNLAALLPEKLRLQQLMIGDSNAVELTEFKVKILRNQTLLSATMLGIRSATKRITDRATASAEMKTYDKSGNLNRVSLMGSTDIRRV